MTKIIFTISTILLFSIMFFAQTSPETQIEWKSFSPENEEFSVDAPDNLTSDSYDDKNEMRRYSGIADGIYFFIFSDEIKSDPQSMIQYKTSLKLVETFQKPEMESRKKSDRMKFMFSDDENFFHTIYAVKTKARAYIFHLVSQKKDDPNVPRFFRNLKVNKKSAKFKFENEPVKKSSVAESGKTKKLPKPDKNSKQQTITSGMGQGNGRGTDFGNGIGNGKGSGLGNGTGRGQGSGLGDGAGSGGGSGFGNGTNGSSQETEDKNLPTKDLSITFKPKAKYNEFARIYRMTGSVRTRVTFLKDGTIGSVTTVTKLPFGLTNSAIQAARQMRFDPKIVKGQPVAVTKVVVFNFTLY